MPTRALKLSLATLLAGSACASAHAEATYHKKKTVTINVPDFNNGFLSSWSLVAGTLAVSKTDAKADGAFFIDKPFVGADSKSTLADAGAAVAKSKADVTFLAGAKTATAMIDLTGSASALAPNGIFAWSSEIAQLKVDVQFVTAVQVITKPFMEITLAPKGAKPIKTYGRKAIVKDPISYDFLNQATNEYLKGDLFDIGAELTAGLGSLKFEDGALNIMAAGVPLSGTFFLTMDNPYLAHRGSLKLSFVDSIVTESVGTGVFSGLLPAIGQSATGSFLLGEYPLDVDFGTGDAVLSGSLGFGLEGMAQESVPEPSSWALMVAGFGVLGFGLRRRRVQSKAPSTDAVFNA